MDGSRPNVSELAAEVPRVAVVGTPIARRARRRVLRPVLMLGGIAAVVVVSTVLWLNGGGSVSSDNAYVRAAKLAVSTDVSGIVAAVEVHEGSIVAKGQVLFRLDPAPFRNALEGAQAALSQARLDVAAMKADYARMRRDIAVKRAETAADQATLARDGRLVGAGGVTRAAYDDARFRVTADQASIAALRETAAVQLARLGGTPAPVVADMPAVRAAQARVDEAQRQLRHTVVRAAFSGITTQVENLQPGQYLAASTAAFGLVSPRRLWVEVNPKETDLPHVKPGDRVNLAVDTYPGRPWQGVVQSIAPASGAEFSVLPAQNATGNWVKVVQRIPVRVRILKQAGAPPLRAGMSVTATITTGHRRHFADLIP